MPENVLQDADVDMAVTVHQRGGCVPQLVYGIAGAAESDFRQILVDHGLHGFRADPCAAVAQEQRIPIDHIVFRPHFDVRVDRRQTGVIQIYHALLVALADDAQRIVVVDHIAQVKRNQLGKAHAAV